MGEPFFWEKEWFPHAPSKENLGGICLNWGCIPTKALLKSAQVYDYLKHVDQYGLKAESIDKDFTAASMTASMSAA